MKTDILEDKHSEANQAITEEFNSTLSSLHLPDLYLSDSSASSKSSIVSVPNDKLRDDDTSSTITKETQRSIALKTFIITIVLIVIILVTSMFFLIREMDLSSNKKASSGNNNGRLNLEKKVPLYLDVIGTGTSFIPSVLFECLGLNHVSITSLEEDSYNVSNISEKVDFLTTSFPNNFCEVVKSNNQLRPFLLMQNPLLRMHAIYKERRDSSSHLFDEDLLSVEFEDYLQIYTQDQNFFTKSILCKKSLTSDDFETAKKVLRSKYTVGIFNYYLDSIQLFLKVNEWEPKNDDNCIEKYGEQVLKRYNEFLSYNGFLNEDSKVNLKDVFDSNSYDVKIYLEFYNEIKKLSDKR